MEPMPAPKKQASTRQVKRAVEREAGKQRRARQTEKIQRQGVTSAAAWRKGRRPVFVELPSGNICKAVNKGLDAFLKAGKVPNALMPIINAALASAEGRPGRNAEALVESPEALSAALELCNTITCECVVDPKIVPVPTRDDGNGVQVEIPLDERDTEELLEILGDGLWVDETDMNDRFFMMNWVMGGTQDLERFREDLADVVDDVHPGEGVEQGSG